MQKSGFNIDESEIPFLVLISIISIESGALDCLHLGEVGKLARFTTWRLLGHLEEVGDLSRSESSESKQMIQNFDTNIKNKPNDGSRSKVFMVGKF